LTVRGTASLDGLNVSFDQTRSIADQRFDMKGDVNVFASYDAANQGRYGFHVRFANPKWPTHDGYVAAYDRFNDLSLRVPGIDRVGTFSLADVGAKVCYPCPADKPYEGRDGICRAAPDPGYDKSPDEECHSLQGSIEVKKLEMSCTELQYRPAVCSGQYEIVVDARDGSLFTARFMGSEDSDRSEYECYTPKPW
jgi:hypothetical protein